MDPIQQYDLAAFRRADLIRDAQEQHLRRWVRAAQGPRERPLAGRLFLWLPLAIGARLGAMRGALGQSRSLRDRLAAVESELAELRGRVAADAQPRTNSKAAPLHVPAAFGDSRSKQQLYDMC